MLTSRITVLVSIFEAGQFLEAKLESLRRQTIFGDCVVVLSNCLNRHGEQALCEKFAAEHRNTVLIQYQRHCTLYEAWNDAIGATQSEFVCNSNVDDQLHPEYLERLSWALIADQTADVALADYCCTNAPNQLWPDWGHIIGQCHTEYPNCGPAPMWRRSLHQRFGLFPPLRVVADFLVWYRWHKNGVKFINVGRNPLTLYYQGQDNLERRLDQAGKSLRELDLESSTYHTYLAETN